MAQMGCGIVTYPACEADDALKVWRSQDVAADHALAEVRRVTVDDVENYSCASV